MSGPGAEVALELAGLPPSTREAKLTHYRVDETHANSYGAWKRMGSPIAANEEQYERLMKASEPATLEDAPELVRVRNGTATLEFALARQGVSLLVFELRGSR